MTEKKNPSYILWVDLETTGLNPQEDQILEIAAVITDFDGEEIDRFHRVIQPAVLDIQKVSHYVRAMHYKSGLWADLFYQGIGDATARSDFYGWLEESSLPRDPAVAHNRKYSAPEDAAPLGGSSVQFDRAFLQAWDPELCDRFLSHRNVDVSTLRSLIRPWTGREFLKQEEHRALPDVLESINELLYYRILMTRGFENL